MPSTKRLIRVVATAAAILLAAGAAGHALRLLIIGQPLITVQEVPIGGTPPQSPPVSVEHVPYSPAIVPLVAAVLLIGGLLLGKLLVAWIGLAVLIGFSVLFLFSSGAALLPVAGLLLILLAIMTLIHRRNRR